MSRQNHSSRWGRCRLWGLVVCTYVLVACSTAENYGVLSFFFDGVPDPNVEVQIAEGGAFIGPPTPSQYAEGGRQGVNRSYSHAPYKNGKCSECHLTGRGSGSMMQGLPTMRKPLNQLCFLCHEIAPRKWAHAPAVSGACSICHAAHNSPNPALLRRPDEKVMCGQCHEGETFPTAQKHSEYGERLCSDCHDPHAADAINFLRPGWEAGAMAEQEASILLKEGKK